MQHPPEAQATNRVHTPAPMQITSTSLLQFQEISPDALITINEAGMIVMVNRQIETMFGYASEELLERPIEMLLPQRFHDTHCVHRERYFSTPRTRPMGAGLSPAGRRKDGTEFPLDISLRPLLLDGVAHVMGAVREMTRQKRPEEQLQRKNEELEEQSRRVQEANRLKSEFLANMSHELRTPLNGIIGFAEIIADGVVGEITAEQKEYLEDILSSSRHLLRLINDILDLAKVESGKVIFHPESVELTKLVNEVRDILHPLIASKRIQVEVEVDAALSPVIIDPSKFKQVLYNYFSNAIKFNPEQGRVVIKVEARDEASFALIVEDTGPGIEPADLDRLFIEFQQLDASAAKRHQGTGLGLALTKGIIEAQGGSVGVTSIPGKGSSFFATLPRIILTPSEEESLPEDYRVLTPQAGVPSVLVIEDDWKDRSRLIRILTEAGYAVEVAETGAEALAQCRTRTFDLITLDLLLPDLGGWDILRAIRSEGPNRNAPVIVITLIAEKKIGISFPIQDMLSKPIQLEELLSSLTRIGVSVPNTVHT